MLLWAAIFLFVGFGFVICRKIKKLEEVDIHMEDLASVIFTWKVDNFSKLDAVKHYSDVFVIGVFEWYFLSISYHSQANIFLYIVICSGFLLALFGLVRRILMYPRGNIVDCLSVYLDVTGSSTLPLGWARHARFSLTIVNQLQSSESLTKGTLFYVPVAYFTFIFVFVCFHVIL